MKDRVIDFRRIRASELLPNPHNWRLHPREQVRAFQEIIAEIGFADVLIVRETSEGYQLLDGHMRAGLLQNEELPVIVVDLDDDEADLLLTTLDPLSAMAEENRDRLVELQSKLSADMARRLKDLPTAPREVERVTTQQPERHAGTRICPECGAEIPR